MSISRDIINDLQDELNSKLEQKNALLGQLTLLDARIDKYDDIIINVDKSCLELVDIINPKITAVKQAYDARISANCRSDLIWVEDDTWNKTSVFGPLRPTKASTYKYKVVKNSATYLSTPYRGLKYYQKPSNRDYGANIVTTFKGSIKSGSTVIAIGDTNSTLSQTAQIGDNITDSLDNPQIFSETNLPSIVGFGTTQTVGIVTTLVGGISTGSKIFAHYGPGISTTGISTGMILECVGIVTSTIVGFGTTTFSIIFLNENGDYESTFVECPSVILNSAAVDVAIEETFTVGILTSSQAVFISTSASGDTINNEFTVIRSGNIDTNFDYRQNPSEPLNIGTLNSSTVGVGHSVSLDVSGNPNQLSTWSPSSSYVDPTTNKVVNPEPLVGGGKAEYYNGTLSWPVIIKSSNSNSINNNLFNSVNNINGINLQSNYTIATEGTVAITTIKNTIGYISSYPGVNPNGSTCTQLQQNIDAAVSELQSTLNQYESQIAPLIEATKALRGDRDRKELQAWSMLQALGSVTEDIQRLERDIQSLINTDFSPFETS